jgi:hypothetical protein
MWMWMGEGHVGSMYKMNCIGVAWMVELVSIIRDVYKIYFSSHMTICGYQLQVRATIGDGVQVK